MLWQIFSGDAEDPVRGEIRFCDSFVWRTLSDLGKRPRSHAKSKRVVPYCTLCTGVHTMAKDKKRSRKAEPKKVEPILEGGDEEVEVEEQEEEAEDVPVGMNTGSDDGSSTGGDDSGEEDEDEAEDRRAVKRLMRAKPVQDTPVPAVPASHFDGGYKNKQRVLTLCSRGVTARARHLLEDLRKLIPHSKKEVKLDCKGKYSVTPMGNALCVRLLRQIIQATCFFLVVWPALLQVTCRLSMRSLR